MNTASAHPHIVDENGAYVCPEAELRDAMDDDTFWHYVLLGPEAIAQHEADVDESDYDTPEWLMDFEPCALCGERGACAYDAEGRPLIHVQPDDDEHEQP